MEPEVKCFHVNAGKPCMRYLEGACGERAAIVRWLKAVPHEVIDNWGLNATAEILDWIESGEYVRGWSGPPNGPAKETP